MASNPWKPTRRAPRGDRLRPAVIDPLEVYGLPSKGETKLHEPKNQEDFYSKIVERYEKFRASEGGVDGLNAAFGALNVADRKIRASPSSNTADGRSISSHKIPTASQRLQDSDRAGDLPTILMAMRKLREGILGSRRHDAFAQQAYIFMIRTSILVRSWESYQPALLHLLQHMHPHVPLAEQDLREFVGYHILDLACRQSELAEALIVERAYKHQDENVSNILRALVQNNWVNFWRARAVMDGHQRAIVDFAAERIRSHALNCLGRSYLNADKAYVERSGGATFEDIVGTGIGWQLEGSGNVIIRKPKAK